MLVLVALAAMFAGSAIQHVIDQRNAARDLYRTQLLTTFWRVDEAEQHQLALPQTQRSAVAIGDVLDGINQDTGVNGQGTLEVSMGAGSVAPPHQAAFSVVVSSPYGSTTVAIWSIQYPGSSDDGACLLSSTLMGGGRARANLELGGFDIQPCPPSWWHGTITPAGPPNLGLAGIDLSGR